MDTNVILGKDVSFFIDIFTPIHQNFSNHYQTMLFDIIKKSTQNINYTTQELKLFIQELIYDYEKYNQSHTKWTNVNRLHYGFDNC